MDDRTNDEISSTEYKANVIEKILRLNHSEILLE